jgi:hypothetical protein
VLVISTAHAAGEQIVMGMPFTGKWAYNVVKPVGTNCSITAHPSCHATSGTNLLGYHWAVDYYAADTTEVKMNATSPQGTVTFSSVSAGVQSCGQGLKVTAKVNGVSVGEAYVTHLNDNPLVSTSIANATSVGTVRNECYGVDHVHFSYKNTVGNNACYVNYSTSSDFAGMEVGYGSNVGVLGSGNGGVQQVCASIPTSTTTTGHVPLLGDVNGDGKADAVKVNSVTGNAWVALSTGTSFSAPQQWSANPAMAGATKYFLANVDGNTFGTSGKGRAALVAFFASSGSWYAATSSGSGFWPPTQWGSNEGNNSSNQFVTDVTGDGKADVVLFWNQVAGQPNGMWAIDASSGSGFWGPPQQWITGAGVQSTSQVVGDFNGDRIADVGMYYSGSGVWNVSLSTGGGFGYPGTWSSGHGMNSNLQFAGDSSGDGKADISYFYNTGANNGMWQVGNSAGSGFWQPTVWATNEGNDGTAWFLADVAGTGKTGVVTYWKAVPGWPIGVWAVDTSSGSGYYGPPNQWITNFGENYN